MLFNGSLNINIVIVLLGFNTGIKKLISGWLCCVIIVDV